MLETLFRMDTIPKPEASIAQLRTWVQVREQAALLKQPLPSRWISFQESAGIYWGEHR